MATTDILSANAIDDVFNDALSDLEFDAFADRPFIRETDTRDDKPTLSPRAQKRKSDDPFSNVDTLGLDSEIKIIKKRQPIAKLDEDRLRSEKGIPKLRTVIRDGQLSRKLRFKGKGHEFNDVAKLLNYYQLWLDELYPRAKFADALQMVEKAGHGKRMAISRCAWIDEGKPGYKDRAENVDIDVEMRAGDDPDLFNTHPSGQVDSIGEHAADNSVPDQEISDSLFFADADDSLEKREDPPDMPDEDELDALLAMQDDLISRISPAKQKPRSPPHREEVNRSTEVFEDDDSEGEDDLDALLAEQDSRQNNSTLKPSQAIQEDETHDTANVDKQPDIQQPEEQADSADELDQLVFEHEQNQKDDHQHSISQDSQRLVGREGEQQIIDFDDDFDENDEETQ